MQKLNDLSRCLTPLEPDGTLIAVIEMSLSDWLVAGIVLGVERQPLKKLAVDESALLKLLHPPPWIVEEHNNACFIVKDATRQALGYFYFEEGARPKISGCPLIGNCGHRLLFEQDGSVANDPSRKWSVHRSAPTYALGQHH